MRKIIYNNPFTKKDVTGRSYLPTRIKYPKWVDEQTLLDGVDNFQAPSVNEFEIERLGDFSVKLQKSPWFPEIQPTLFFNEIFDYIKKNIPTSNEILPWMQEATAMNVFLQQRMEEYNQHSEVIAKSGDGNWPGVIVDRIGFRDEPGWDVYAHGAHGFVITNKFTQRNNTGQFHILKDILSWTGVHASPDGYQWVGVAAKWRVVADTPLTAHVGFIGGHNCYGNFFVQTPPQKSERIVVQQVYASPQAQNVKITFRDPNDYTRTIDSSTLTLEEPGNYSIRYEIASYPAVPPVLVQLETENPCAINKFVVNSQG